MLYDCLKIIHILSASLLLLGMVTSLKWWRNLRTAPETIVITERIQTLTLLVIIPLGLLQLASGFTIMGLQHYDFSEFWVQGSVGGFLITISSWLGFIYFLLWEQQLSMRHPRVKMLKRIQWILLHICGASLLLMIFFMVSKTPTLSGIPYA